MTLWTCLMFLYMSSWSSLCILPSFFSRIHWFFIRMHLKNTWKAESYSSKTSNMTMLVTYERLHPKLALSHAIWIVFLCIINIRWSILPWWKNTRIHSAHSCHSKRFSVQNSPQNQVENWRNLTNTGGNPGSCSLGTQIRSSSWPHKVLKIRLPILPILPRATHSSINFLAHRPFSSFSLRPKDWCRLTWDIRFESANF